MFYSIDNYIEDEDYKRFTVSHGLWDVETSNVENGNTSYDCLPCADEEHSYVTYTIDLTRRQNTANFLNLILPCLVMSAMTFLVIFLPHGNGAETATFGLTCILTLMVFVAYLFTSLPTTGQPILGKNCRSALYPPKVICQLSYPEKIDEKWIEKHTHTLWSNMARHEYIKGEVILNHRDICDVQL